MILTCPSCGTRYQTDRARIAAPGCNVRCAKCLHVWFHVISDGQAESAPEMPAAAFDELFVPSAKDQKAAPRESARRPDSAFRMSMSPAVIAGWIALNLFNAAFITAVVVYRQSIAEVWSQSATFYSVIGLPVNVRGLDITDVVPQQEFADGQAVLQVSGTVVNISDRELPVPELRVRLQDSERRELYGWTFAIDAATLRPGEADPFVARLTNPPPETRSLDVLFSDAPLAGAAEP